MKTLQLYSRPGCHLCDRLEADLAPLLPGTARIERIDISEDPALLRQYGLRIPVLAANGLELSGYPLDADRVRAYLAS